MYDDKAKELLSRPPRGSHNGQKPATRRYQRLLRRIERKFPAIDLAALLGRNADGTVHRGSNWFYPMSRLACPLLDNDPAKALPKRSVKLRGGLTHWLFLRLGKYFFEGMRQQVVIKEPLPDDGRPLIFAPTHYFIQETLSSILLAEKHAFIVFGTLPHFFNTHYGAEAYLNGSILLDRKDKASRHAVFAKAERLLKSGTGIIIYPEGAWNKSPNRLILPLWRGVFRIAQKADAWIIPMAHLGVGDMIYSARLAPIDHRNYTAAQEQQALSDLRDSMATGLWLMMEQYAATTRAEFLQGCRTMHERAAEIVRAQTYTSGYYYDHTVEAGPNATDLRLPGDPRPADVWRALAEIDVTPQNVHAVLYARQLLDEDYQRRY